jgi:hypothetical protein
LGFAFVPPDSFDLLRMTRPHCLRVAFSFSVISRAALSSEASSSTAAYKMVVDSSSQVTVTFLHLACWCRPTPLWTAPWRRPWEGQNGECVDMSCCTVVMVVGCGGHRSSRCRPFAHGQGSPVGAADFRALSGGCSRIPGQRLYPPRGLAFYCGNVTTTR